MKRLIFTQILFIFLFADIGSAVLPSQKMEYQSDEQVRQRARIAEQRARIAEQRAQAAEQRAQAAEQRAHAAEERLRVAHQRLVASAQRLRVADGLIATNGQLNRQLAQLRQELGEANERANNAELQLYPEKENQIEALMELLPSSENFSDYFDSCTILQADRQPQKLTHNSMRTLLWAKNVLRLEFNHKCRDIKSLEEKLPQILEIVKEMDFLEAIVIRSENRRFSSLPVGFFNKLRNLKEIEIYAYIRTIDDDIYHAQNLRYVHLSNTLLLFVSPHLFTLPHLEYVNLEDSDIHSLPNTVRHFMDREIHVAGRKFYDCNLLLSGNPFYDVSDDEEMMGITEILDYHRTHNQFLLSWHRPETETEVDDDDDDDSASHADKRPRIRGEGEE